jgi:hypothetical protein
MQVGRETKNVSVDRSLASHMAGFDYIPFLVIPLPVLVVPEATASVTVFSCLGVFVGILAHSGDFLVVPQNEITCSQVW